MSLPKVISQSAFCVLLLLAETAAPGGAGYAQDLSKTVLPITEFKLKLKKKSSPSSIGWTALELRYPLPHYHGIVFRLDGLESDEEVDIYAYPANSIHPLRKLVPFHGAYKGQTHAGFLAFEYEGKPIHGGSSGGLVVDSRSHQIIGILSRAGLGKNGKEVALAVPVQSLADFVSKVQPWLAQTLFPSANKESVSPASADLYPEFAWVSSNDTLQHRRDEPPEIKTLRKKAQEQADSMRSLSQYKVLPGDLETSCPQPSRNMKSRSWKASSDSASIPTARKSFRTSLSATE